MGYICLEFLTTLTLSLPAAVKGGEGGGGKKKQKESRVASRSLNNQ